MENNDVSKCQCSAVESDWLDITYTQRKYLQEEREASDYKPEKKLGNKTKNLITTVAAILVIIGVVCGMIFINGGSDIFETAKMAYISTIFDDKSGAGEINSVELPLNEVVQGVNTDGTVKIGGGRVCVNLVEGEVKSVTESSVTVEIDADVCLVYSNLTEVLATAGQKVDINSVLGKYSETMNVNVVIENVVVTNIVGTEKSFEWSD